MGLIGTYVNSDLEAKLVITTANDANGNGSGTLQMGVVTLSVNIHYHFENSVGPATTLYFYGNQDDPNYYLGMAGLTDNRTYSNIQISGGLAKTNGVIPFSGVFTRS